MRRHHALTTPTALFTGAGDEPALADLLADPILHLLLRCDRLSEGDLQVAIDRGRAALRRRRKGGVVRG